MPFTNLKFLFLFYPLEFYKYILPCPGEATYYPYLLPAVSCVILFHVLGSLGESMRNAHSSRFKYYINVPLRLLLFPLHSG